MCVHMPLEKAYYTFINMVYIQCTVYISISRTTTDSRPLRRAYYAFIYMVYIQCTIYISISRTTSYLTPLTPPRLLHLYFDPTNYMHPSAPLLFAPQV